MCFASAGRIWLVPAVPYRDPNNYVRYSERLANELAETTPKGVIWANQFDNVANRDGHFTTTGPEFWDQTEGRVNGFICAVGSGGTLAGTGMYLKSKIKIQIGLADPMGSALYHHYAHGSLKAEGGLCLRDRPGPDHRQSGGCACGQSLSDHRCRSPADDV